MEKSPTTGSDSAAFIADKGDIEHADKPEEEVASDHGLVNMRADPEEDAAGDGEEAGGHGLQGKAKIPNPEEEEEAGEGKTKILNPEEEVAGDGATKKRSSIFDFFDQPMSAYYKYRDEQYRKSKPFLDMYDALKYGKKIKKVKVPMIPAKSEVGDAMLKRPPLDLSYLDEVPEGFDLLPEKVRLAYIRSGELVKKYAKEEEILEQYRTQRQTWVERYVIEE